MLFFNNDIFSSSSCIRWSVWVWGERGYFTGCCDLEIIEPKHIQASNADLEPPHIMIILCFMFFGRSFASGVISKKPVAGLFFLSAPFVIYSRKLLQWNKFTNTKTMRVLSLHKRLHVLARQVFLLEHAVDEWWGLYFRLFNKYCSSELTCVTFACLTNCPFDTGENHQNVCYFGGLYQWRLPFSEHL